jgi:dihydrofolate reductase (trimethoprim resistance protein)
MNDTLKAAGNLGAELGAVKRENEKLREIAEDAGRELQAWIASFPRASHHQAKALIARISAALSQQAEPAEPAQAQDELPEELFDGHAVYTETVRHRRELGLLVRTSPENVSDTLDAVVRLARARAPFSANFTKFRMGDRVKKSTGSEWVGKVVGWYRTEQTPEGYAVESEAHAGSVQIYPAKALEAVDV